MIFVQYITGTTILPYLILYSLHSLYYTQMVLSILVFLRYLWGRGAKCPVTLWHSRDGSLHWRASAYFYTISSTNSFCYLRWNSVFRTKRHWQYSLLGISFWMGPVLSSPVHVPTCKLCNEKKKYNCFNSLKKYEYSYNTRTSTTEGPF